VLGAVLASLITTLAGWSALFLERARLSAAASDLDPGRVSLAPSEEAFFEDVPPDHWAYTYIQILHDQGYIAGCSTDPPLYCPEDTMTRGESAVFVERGLWGGEYLPPDPIDPIFADVPLAEWYAKWATALWEDGYTAGCGMDPLIFCPLRQHTIAEGCVFFLRMMHGADYEPPAPQGLFQDVALGTWYAKWVEQAYNDGILLPCETEPTLRACPLDPLDRATGAYMMVQAKGLLEPSQGVYVDNHAAASGDGSMESPFKTLAEGLAVLEPGDTLYLRGDPSGRVYEETLSFPRAGTESAPITVMAYPGERVIIASEERIFRLDQPYWHFTDLVFDHQGGSRDAIQIRGGHGAFFLRVEIRNGRRNGIQIFNGNDIRIKDSSIHNFDTGTPGDDAHCIVTDPTSSSNSVENLQLLNNEIYDCSGDGIQFYASSSTPRSEYATNVLIQGNTFYKNAGFYGENAIDAKGADGVRVIGNEIYGFDSNKAVVIQKGSSNFRFEGNVIHSSHRGLEMRGEDGKSQSGHVLLRNLFYDIYGEYVIKFDDVHGAVVQHNTLVDNNAESFRIEEEGLTQGDIRNNLIAFTGKAKVSGTLEAQVGHNGWFSADPGSLSQGTDLLGEDPQFLDRAGRDYRLQPDSPAVDAGVDLGLAFNGAAPDLGAFEVE
jgi:hypothetical protein